MEARVELGGIFWLLRHYEATGFAIPDAMEPCEPIQSQPEPGLNSPHEIDLQNTNLDQIQVQEVSEKEERKRKKEEKKKRKEDDSCLDDCGDDCECICCPILSCSSDSNDCGSCDCGDCDCDDD